jgi:hypothetical protein
MLSHPATGTSTTSLLKSRIDLRHVDRSIFLEFAPVAGVILWVVVASVLLWAIHAERIAL